MTRKQAYLAPVLLGVALLIHAYAPTHSHWTVIVRPEIVVLAVTVVVTSVLLVVTRSPAIASAVTCALVVIAYEWRLALLLALIAAVALTAGRIRLESRDRIMAGALIAPGAILLALGLVRSVSNGTVTLADFTIPATAPMESAAVRSRPNIYLLLLDGYPRQDTLANDFGYDNEPFLHELEDLGFAVNRDASSTFTRTELSLASTQVPSLSQLSPYVADREFGLEPAVETREIRRALLVATEAMSSLRELGYDLTYIPPPVGDVEWSGWDSRRDPGHITEFEAALLQKTPLRHLLGSWLLDNARGRVVESLDLWSREAEGQHVTFAHLMAPHPPFVWDGDREVGRPTDCWYAGTCSLFAGFGLGLTPDDYGVRMAAQVDGLNARLLPAIQRIVADDPSAIIIVFSDHGTRYRSEASEEARRTLFAARETTAESIDGLFPHLLRELDASR